MKNFSKNVKLNIVLNKIYDDLLELGYEEIKRYKKEFPNEVDYNIYQYGNMLIYNNDIEQLYKNAGYKSKFNYIDTYKRQIRYLINTQF